MPFISAEKYMPVPPHRIGSAQAFISASAAPRHQAALAGSAAARTPYSRCGASASSSGEGRAVISRSSR